jgi:hypothetical protein
MIPRTQSTLYHPAMPFAEPYSEKSATPTLLAWDTTTDFDANESDTWTLASNDTVRMGLHDDRYSGYSHYTFEERSGSTLADVNGESGDATAHNTSWLSTANVPTRFAGALLFDGSTSYVDVPTALQDPAGEHQCFLFGIYPPALSGTEQVIIEMNGAFASGGYAGDSYISQLVYDRGGNGYLGLNQYNGGTGTWDYNQIIDIPAETWSWVLMTMDGGSTELDVITMEDNAPSNVFYGSTLTDFAQNNVTFSSIVLGASRYTGSTMKPYGGALAEFAVAPHDTFTATNGDDPYQAFSRTHFDYTSNVDSGFTTSTKIATTAMQPSLQANALINPIGQYESFGEGIDVTVVGSPNTGNEEHHTVSLSNGDNTYSITWANDHSEFRCEVEWERDTTYSQYYLLNVPVLDYLALLP